MIVEFEGERMLCRVEVQKRLEPAFTG
jgi:hypothetical protein